MSRGYVARAAASVERDVGGRTRLTRLRSDGPLALRETAEALYLVGAAAGPLGGDDFELALEIGPDARLAIRSVATTLALPGDSESRMTVRATVAAGGHLDFAPEPTVAAAGCHHRSTAAIDLAEGATLRWYEELILGRHLELPGKHTSRFDVTRDGVPLLRHELRLDDPAVFGSRSVVGDAKAIGSVLLVAPDLSREPHTAEGLAVLPLAGSGVLIAAAAGNSAVLRRRLAQGEELAGSGTSLNAMNAGASSNSA
ncbi:urease accessory protein UreD [Actinomadura rudentiformis]|uniref:Urease accessory protein UreD n=1 Tax=Actinomadura rudentiformis TaxID=359158 RepID=A0A6H9YYS6_9ACTN|nr:urease accessory protein UreD [Actinomadura rudentiformis]KAB2345557.1 urease accessory protein UreD [Actinomadura rudentiformis]